METCYQYDTNGYYAGTDIVYNNLLPNNCTMIAPEEKEGFIPHWDGSAWENIENHKGEKGYVDGEASEIKEYGPYPEGWSTTPPEPTPEEIKQRRIEEIDREIKALEDSADRAVQEKLDPETSAEDLVFSNKKITATNKAKKTLREERAALGATA